MPIYEYECQKCGEVFEVFQRVSDPPPKRHDCGSRKVKRVMSQTSFILKGTGWYVTDYARKEQAQKENAAGGKRKKSEAANESKEPSKKDKTEKKAKKESSDSKGKGGGTRAAA